MTARDKFQALLRELFQFDCADLDFGIYRIMNYKRDVLEKFTSSDLPELIGEELRRDTLADQSQAAAELAETAEEIARTLGKDALDADGNLVQFQETEIGKKYLSLQAKAAGGRGRDALEALIFNHLYTFFSRYYQDGDFISKRRYSKRQKYAIPYNGEEVYLHWANQDQYYVKTVEHLHDYTFTSQGVTVHFKLTAANVEQNNVKGDKRLLLPRIKEIDWRERESQLVIPFEWRPLTEQEKVTYGTKNQQDKIIAEACEAIPQNLKRPDKALAAIIAERRKDSHNQPVTFLEHHLRQYTQKNTSDFFIHKDLKGFLSRELDFYLKNEVLNLDEMEVAGEGRSEGWFQVVRVIKAVGGRIIDFLHQIESFQKMLWEKRKFVTETQYCISIGTIDERFYREIAACDEQWGEWKELFHIDEEQADLFTSGKTMEERRVAFLKTHPTLVIDTKYFKAPFINAVLEHFVDIDAITDCLLLHGENFQSLQLIGEHFRGQLSAAYYDPPYNTSEETFVYKNSYRHSSWLSMMADRIGCLRRLLTEDGALILAIDDAEAYRLKLAVDHLLGEANYIGTIAVQSNPRGRGINSYYATSHDYYLVYAADADAVRIVDQPLTDTQAEAYRHSDDTSQFRLLPFRRSGGLSTPDARPNSEFTLYYSTELDRIFAVGGSRQNPYPEKYEPLNIIAVLGEAFEPREMTLNEFKTRAPDDVQEILPLDSDGNRRVWRWSDRTKILKAAFDGEFVVRIDKARPSVLLKDRIKEGRKPKTVWADSKYDASSHGTNLLQDIIGSRGLFGYPKSIHSTYDSLYSIVGDDREAIVLDAFAGSGTTAHAVIMMNRNDDGRRKTVLAEMGKYFDTVLLPRVKKVAFAPEWKDGKPERPCTPEEAERSPRIIKYHRLESYEDSLGNIQIEEPSGQEALRFDDYLLKYMIHWETRKSQTLLSIDKLAKPFSYKLIVAKGDETIEKTVDIPETFNYLLGLHVCTRKVYDDSGRRYLVYRGRIGDRRIAVIWRDADGWDKEGLERDKKFVAEHMLAEGADEVLVNGDSFIPNARVLDPIFKARMFAPVEA